jgi:predicted ATPase
VRPACWCAARNAHELMPWRTKSPRPIEPHAGGQQLQQALTDWLHALAAERQIVIPVDDIEHADEESMAWLTALARQGGSARVLLVVSTRSAHQALPLEMFGRAATRVLLAPLTALEVEELLRSVFGPVDYLARVASVVHRMSQGRPAHCVELLEHLVDRDLAEQIALADPDRGRLRFRALTASAACPRLTKASQPDYGPARQA